jgi:uncharacterized protein YxeA
MFIMIINIIIITIIISVLYLLTAEYKLLSALIKNNDKKRQWNHGSVGFYVNTSYNQIVNKNVL